MSDIETISKHDSKSIELEIVSPVNDNSTSPANNFNGTNVRDGMNGFHGPYRLYKRRFLGLFGMVCPAYFSSLF